MTLEDKLRFLADRVKDEKEFYIDDELVRFGKENLIISDGLYLDIVNLSKSSLRLKPAWEFTEDEKAILRNLNDEWRWVARDSNGTLYTYLLKPIKLDSIWAAPRQDFASLRHFNHLFKSVRWEDDEPCEFRKYV